MMTNDGDEVDREHNVSAGSAPNWVNMKQTVTKGLI